MSTAPALRSPALFRWYGPFVAALASRALGLLYGKGALARAEHTGAARLVRAAEAMARRLVIFAALDEDLTPTPAKPRRRSAPRRRHPRANLLPLFDPRASRPPPDWAAIKAARSPDTRLPSHRLRARASAAAAVIEDPSAMAQRLARWMRRRAQRAAAPITERSRPERAQIVGIRPPRRAGLTRAECAALRELTQAGRAAWPPPGPPLAAP